MWGYYWGLTAAQIELLSIDAPLLVYNKDKKRGKGENKPVNANKMQKKIDEWNEKYKDGNLSAKLDLTKFK